MGPAVLGGTVDAFIAEFGQPNDHSSAGMPHFKQCSNSNVDQLILLDVSNPGHVESITVAACTPWTVSQAKTNCSAFFPADAVYKRTVQIPGPPNSFPSVDKIYYSATLAHEFAADVFTDANGNPVQPGLFDVNYLYISNTDLSHIDSCDVIVGTQQTQG